MAIAPKLPMDSEPVVQKSPSGAPVFARTWRLFFQGLAQLANAAATAASAIAVGASPFSYEATANGIVIVQGGTVTALAYGRGGAFTNLGVTQGPIPMSAGDVLRVTHAGAPTMTLVPQ